MGFKVHFIYAIVLGKRLFIFMTVSDGIISCLIHKGSGMKMCRLSLGPGVSLRNITLINRSYI